MNKLLQHFNFYEINNGYYSIQKFSPHRDIKHWNSWELVGNKSTTVICKKKNKKTLKNLKNVIQKFFSNNLKPK